MATEISHDGAVESLVRGAKSEPPARADASDWRWQLRHAATTVEHLSKVLHLTEDEIAGARRA